MYISESRLCTEKCIEFLKLFKGKQGLTTFQNENEKLQFTNELISTTRKTILNNLLLIASKGVWTEEARELYNYLNK